MKKMTILLSLMLICCLSAGAVAEQAVTKEGGKTLVVYFSATGNTQEVGRMIAEQTNADVLELEPETAYTSEDLDWRDEESRVVYEHEHPEAQTVKLVQATVENWAEYDVVYIGYPIWWRAAAWPVNEFITTNDFTGKTVIPFCTSSSSEVGDSGTMLAQMAGTGNWVEGVRFSSGDEEETVLEWLNSLDFSNAVTMGEN